MYDTETGHKVRSLTDYKMTPSSSVALHRSYHYYNTEANQDNVYQYITQPGVYEYRLKLGQL